jgi:hypothetical protein
MRRFLAARVPHPAACVLLMLLMVLVRPAGAQTWNDPRSRALVEGATQRRVEQLADTALRDYRATAHGYVAFLAQLGEGLRTPPKVIKTDELVNEVYWRAPNLSKQRIVGRRDTLLLPTDIAYHADHLGIIQNNFPDIIRVGEGDEVADVPHPLSRAGLALYDFALADSFSIGAASQRIHVYEVKIRPKDDRLPRVVGAAYIDQASHQVVRLNLTFTSAAFLDKALEELSVVLENRLVAGRFWLPSRQEIEIRRKGEWLEYPARGIIRGRWEIGDYQINQELAPAIFTGPEIVIAPPQILAQHQWQGRILDSLPPDVLAITEPEIARVQEEARAIVRAQALAAAKRATLSARRISDFARFDRVEGFAFGTGLQKQLGSGWTTGVRGRYGIDDKQGKGEVNLSWLASNGSTFRLFASRDFRELGDIDERSSVVNSLAAQEFGSDDTDPYLVRGVGGSYGFSLGAGLDARLTGSYEIESSLAVHARPVTGTFEPTVDVAPSGPRHATVLTFGGTRPLQPWLGSTDLSMRVEARARIPTRDDTPFPRYDQRTFRGFALAEIQRPIRDTRLVASASVAGTTGGATQTVSTELVYLGGPVSAPGYDFHSLISNVGATGHLEWRLPAPFPAFSLGRYGRVPARGSFAPYVHAAAIGNPTTICVPVESPTPSECPDAHHFFPSAGAAYLLPFDILRIDVARGLGHQGRWFFGVDVSRDFWSIL